MAKYYSRYKTKDQLREQLKSWEVSPIALSLFEELPIYLQHGNKLSHLSLTKREDRYELRYSNTIRLYDGGENLEEIISEALEIIKEDYPNGRYKKRS